MLRRFSILLLFCGMILSLSAQTLSENSRISILTCEPGMNLYEKYGHTAIRVYDKELGWDLVFNYGLFSFETDHFYYKFIKGETWYQLGVESMEGFRHAYLMDNRCIHEQIINLTQEEKQQVWEALIINYQPENRYYLYNFVFDNCATRPYQLIVNALSDSIVSDYEGNTSNTYRQFLSHYTGVGSWADFGINLLFGPRADKPMNSEQRLFLPEELMHYLSHCKRSNGSSLILRENIGTFTIQPTPWYKTWYFGLSVAFLLLVAVTFYDRKRKKLSIWLDIIIAVAMCIVLLIVTFLTFFSIHPLVGFGWRLFIIPVLHLCARIIYFIR